MKPLVTQGQAPEETVSELQQYLARSNNRLSIASRPLSAEASSKPMCSMCGDTGWQRVEKDGATAGVRPCPCAVERDLQRKLAKIAPRDRWARIERLEPCLDPSQCFAPVELQRQVIQRLRENPDGSYAFFSPSGCGKTTYMAALYAHAVETQRRACFYVQMADMVRELREVECGREIIPYLSREVLREAVKDGLRPRVFLDECDKLKPTEFAVGIVHEVFDELYRLCGEDSPGVQLVVATNLGRDEFAQAWGANVLRRIEAVCEVLDYFEVLGTRL